MADIGDEIAPRPLDRPLAREIIEHGEPGEPFLIGQCRRQAGETGAKLARHRHRKRERRLRLRLSSALHDLLDRRPQRGVAEEGGKILADQRLERRISETRRAVGREDEERVGQAVEQRLGAGEERRLPFPALAGAAPLAKEMKRETPRPGKPRQGQSRGRAHLGRLEQGVETAEIAPHDERHAERPDPRPGGEGGEQRAERGAQAQLPASPIRLGAGATRWPAVSNTASPRRTVPSGINAKGPSTPR